MKVFSTSFTRILVVIFLLRIGTSYAQHSFSPSTTLIKNQAINTMTYDSIHISSTASDTLFLNWKLLSYDTLAGTYFDFCSSGICWIWVPDSGSFPPIEPGGFGYAGMHFWTGNFPTTSTCKIWVYEKGNPSVGDTLTYVLTGHVLGVNGHNGVNELFSIGPNPTKGTVNVTGTKYKAESIDIYNSEGKLQYSSPEASSIDLSGWPDQTYLVLVRSEAGTSARRIVLCK